MNEFNEKIEDDSGYDDEVGTGYIILNGAAFCGITEKDGATVLEIKTTLKRFGKLGDFLDKLVASNPDEIEHDEMEIKIDDDNRLEMVFHPDE